MRTQMMRKAAGIIVLSTFMTMSYGRYGEGFKKISTITITITMITPVVVARGSGKVKSCKDHDGAQRWELRRPTTECCGNNEIGRSSRKIASDGTEETNVHHCELARQLARRRHNVLLWLSRSSLSDGG